MKGILIAAVAVLAVAVGVALGVFLLERPARGIPADGVIFSVEAGESLSAIADRLEREGLIRSSLLLRFVARLNGTEGRFKAGYYRIRPGYSTRGIHDLLVEGRQDQVSVTIPEGWTAGQVARHLEAKGVARREEFLAAVASAQLRERYRVPGPTLEGFLFPDTYFLSPNMPAELIVQDMVDNFFRRLSEQEPDAAALPPDELYRKVLMASIVEREYRVAEEAPLMASVFYNRLRDGVGLESCATVAYIITEIQGKPYPSVITASDLKIDSPYNTYKWAGFPPAPISNPGLTALEASFHPAATDFYYFVLRDADAGSHYFSKDLDEHNSAKRFFLKGVGTGG